GIANYEIKRYTDAIIDIEDAIRYFDENNNKKLSELYNLKGLALSGNNDDQEAAQSYIMSFQLDDNNTGALNNLGSLFIKRKQYNYAEKYLLQAIKIHPNNNFANGNLARLYSKTGKLDKAMKYIEMLFKPQVDEEVGRKNIGNKFTTRGFIHYKKYKLDEALNDLNRAIKLNSLDFDAYMYRGLVFLKMKLYKKACKDFQKAERRSENEFNKNDINELITKHCN